MQIHVQFDIHPLRCDTSAAEVVAVAAWKQLSCPEGYGSVLLFFVYLKARRIKVFSDFVDMHNIRRKHPIRYIT
jgi:hypothetical protein